MDRYTVWATPRNRPHARATVVFRTFDRKEAEAGADWEKHEHAVTNAYVVKGGKKVVYAAK